MGIFGSSSEFDWQREWSRLYTAIEIPFGGRSVELKAGDGNISYIRGWTLTFGFVGGRPSIGQEIVATLVLRYPQNGDVSYRIEDFDVSQGGAIFIPWPQVDLTFRDLSTQDSAGREASQVVVSFVPALSDETVAPGLQSIVYGRSHRTFTALPGDDAWSVPVPCGATSYLTAFSFPELEDVPSPEKLRVWIEESSQERIWHRYWIVPEVQPVLYQVIGSSWKRTPPGPGAKVSVRFGKNYPEKLREDAAATVQWQYELGGYR